jgi:cob(I)alamin adenosyltransferase
MAPFYTGDGDQGKTGYLGEGRISKTSLRIEAVGSVDEANAALGLARSIAIGTKTKDILLKIQKQLYFLMTELSADPKVSDRFDKIGDDEIQWLEEQISDIESLVDLQREFIIPGENLSSGALSLARAIVRRAERRTIDLLEANEIQKTVLVTFLNRLSSLVFILEVYEASLSGSGVRLVKGE